MAKVTSLFKIRGSIGDATYFENEYGPQVKQKGGPTDWQVKNLPQFARTRRNAGEWKRATAASQLSRKALGNLYHSIKNMRLSGRLIGRMLDILQADPIHDLGEREVASGDLSLLRGFEFNPTLPLDDALPLNIANHIAVEPGKVVVNIPAFRLRHKKNIPAAATHYRLVSCILTIDYEKRTHRQDKQAGALQAMGRKSGEAFCMEQVVQPDNEQGCFWLMGIEFYKMVNEQPVLVRGGALRVMEWMGKACSNEVGSEQPAAVEGMAYGVSNEVLAKACAEAAPVETAVEEIGAVYREYMEEVLAAACNAIAETDPAIAAIYEAAMLPEAENADIEATAATPMEFTSDTALVGDEEEFEKSLRVLLPAEGHHLREVTAGEMQTDVIQSSSVVTSQSDPKRESDLNEFVVD